MGNVRKWNEILRSERESRNWTQAKVANALRTDPKRVSEWEVGKTKPSYKYRRMLAKLFGKSAEELGFLTHEFDDEVSDENSHQETNATAIDVLPQETNAAQPDIPNTAPLPQPIQLLIPNGAPVYVTIQIHEQMAAHVGIADSHLVQSTYNAQQQNMWIPPETNGVDRLRRKLLEQLLKTAGLSIFASQELLNEDAWERLLRTLDKPYSLDETALTHLEQLTDFHWELYRSALAKVDLLSSVLGHLQTVTRLLEHRHPISVQRRLCSIVSNTAQIIGEIYFDMNQCIKATTYYDLAIDAAQEADNHRLYSLALGRKGFLPIYLGHSEESLSPLQYAYALAQQTTTGKSKSWLITMQAEAFSNLKNKRECLDTLEQAERVISLADDGEDAHWTGFSRETLAGYEGICYMRLEMPKEARNVLQQSLESLPAGPTRRKSIVLSDLATTYAQEGEVEEACRIADESLLIATRSKSARAIQRLRELQHRLQPWNDHISVKRFNDQLAAFSLV